MPEASTPRTWTSTDDRWLRSARLSASTSAPCKQPSQQVETREYVHAVAIPHEVIQGPEGAPEEALDTLEVPLGQPPDGERPGQPGNRWKDDAANFSPHLTDLVEQGKVLAVSERVRGPWDYVIPG